MDGSWFKSKTGVDLGTLSRVLGSRRAWVALFSVACLTALGIHNHLDTSMAIAAIATAIAAADGYEKKGKPDAL
jgi:hypothetical protein